MMTLEMFSTGVLQGLLLALVAFGVMIPFRVLHVADLTSEGSYPLGGALTASLLVFGFDPCTATLCGMTAGGLMGMLTALIYWYLKVNTLLAGIILSTMVYSINLRLMGRPNIPLFTQTTLFSWFNDVLLVKIFLALVVVLLVTGFIYGFLLTEKGLQLRAVGLNQNFAQRQGINHVRFLILGLCGANALSALAGSLMVQLQAYADVGMGSGIVIHGLAAFMIGESFVGTRTLARQLCAPIVGALVYQQLQGLVISLGLAPSDLKLITGILVLITIGYRYLFLRDKGII